MMDREEITRVLVLQRLRENLNVSSDIIDDAEVLRVTKGTFLRARVDLGVALYFLLKDVLRVSQEALISLGKVFIKNR